MDGGELNGKEVKKGEGRGYLAVSGDTFAEGGGDTVGV